jgi:hypothetical protein
MTKHVLTPLGERFEAKWTPEPNSGCWLWVARVNGKGYGTISLGRDGDGEEMAHRVSWMLYRGPIPAGLHVLHKCDVRACVNPNHLFVGTNADNMADRNAKGRQSGPRGPRRSRQQSLSHTQGETT